MITGSAALKFTAIFSLSRGFTLRHVKKTVCKTLEIYRKAGSHFFQEI